MAAVLTGRAHCTQPPVVRQVAALRAQVAEWATAGESVGLVPTMGALHDGHLALLRRAKAECRRAIATIFVNPAQFGPSEDFAAYPRDEARDRALLGTAGCDLLFAPPTEEVYPAGFSTTVAVKGLTRHLCGPFRPGHFAGVATVVTKLLLMTQPARAYFGEKDFQQLQVIRRLARDLDIPTLIVGVPTVREADGLALSSRNRYLTSAERQTASALPRLMQELAAALAAGTEVEAALAEGRARLAAAGFDRVDYLELADEATLTPTAKPAGPARLFAATWIGRTRLIDNWPVTLPDAAAAQR
ncbi:MAG: pantoate--beta-alanine ligase [Pseudomonadota bacterium]